MRKAMGVAGLLALLVLPLTGSAGATDTKTSPKKVCATVQVAAAVDAGANIGLTGRVLSKDIFENVPANVDAKADVFVRICAFVDAVVLTPKTPETKPVECSDGKAGIELKVLAELRTSLLVGGNVRVTVDVIVGDKEKNVAQETLELNANVNVADAELAKLAVCVEADI